MSFPIPVFATVEYFEVIVASAKKDQGIYHMLLRYLAATSCCADRSELLHDCATFYHSQFAQVTSAVLQENADLHMKLQKAKADAVKNYGKVRNFIGRVSGNSSAKLRRKAFEEWKKSCIHRKQHMETLQKVLGSSTKRSLMLRHFSMWKDAIESWRKVRGVASASKMILDQRNTLEVLLNQAREALQQEKAANQQANEYSQHLLSKIDEMHAEETAREASLKNALVDIEKSVVCDAPPLRGGLGAFEHALATNAAILDHIEAAKTTSADAACQTTATVRNIRSRHGSRRGKRRKKKSKAGGPLPSSSNMKNERGEASAEEQVSFGSLVDMERAHLEQILTDFQNSSPCFHGSRLEAGDLAAIADKCEIRSFSENDLLYSEAEEAAWFGFVLGGTLQRTGLFDSDQEITPGTVILEEGVIAGKLYASSIRATSAGQIVIFRYKDIHMLHSVDEKLSSRILEAIERSSERKIAVPNATAISSVVDDHPAISTDESFDCVKMRLRVMERNFLLLRRQHASLIQKVRSRDTI